MGLFGRAREGLKSVVIKRRKKNFDKDTGTFSGESDPVFSAQRAKRDELISLVVEWIVTHSTGVTWRVVNHMGQDVPAGIEILDLLRRPNRGSLTGFIPTTLRSLLYAGDAVWLLDKPDGFMIENMYFLPPWTWEPANRGSLATQYGIGGVQAWRVDGLGIVPADRVLHLRIGENWSYDVRLGMSPFYQVWRETLADEEARMAGIEILRNLSVGDIHSLPLGTPQQAVDDHQKKLERRRGGAKRGLPITTTGEVAVNRQQIGSRFGFDFRSLRDTPEERICAAGKIVPSVLGLGSGTRAGAVGATRREETRNSFRSGVIPPLEDIGGQLSEALLPLWGLSPGLNRVQYDARKAIALQMFPRELAELRRIETGGQGWKTPNQIREEEGDEPHESGDSLTASGASSDDGGDGGEGETGETDNGTPTNDE